MSSDPTTREISRLLKHLPPADLQKILAYARELEKGAVTPQDRGGAHPLRGALDPADAEEMKRIIEEGCESIDESTW